MASTRYNLWLTLNGHSKVLCWGTQGEMNDLVGAFAGIDGDIHILPDQEEPILIPNDDNS